MRGWANDNQRPMVTFLTQLLLAICSRLTRRARLEAENLILRPQLGCTSTRLYPSLLGAIIIVQPETVIRWHRRGFRTNWRWKSRRVGRPSKDRFGDARVIRRMSREYRLWNAGSTASC